MEVMRVSFGGHCGLDVLQCCHVLAAGARVYPHGYTSHIIIYIHLTSIVAEWFSLVVHLGRKIKIEIYPPPSTT